MKTVNSKKKTSKNKKNLAHRSKKVAKVDLTIKSRYHLKKILFPIGFFILIALATVFLFTTFNLADKVELWVAKNKYLTYGTIVAINVFSCLYVLFKIKEFVSFSMLLDGNVLYVKSYTRLEIPVETVTDVFVLNSGLGVMLGYATLRIVTNTKSIYGYTNIIHSQEISDAVYAINKKRTASIESSKKDNNRSY